MKRYIKITGGFTLIEALVAISILTIAVTGPLSLAAKGLSYSSYAKDEITAFYLANEAIDVIRNIRDTNIYTKDSSSWLLVPDDPSSLTIVGKCGGAGCFFDAWHYPIIFNPPSAADNSSLNSCVGSDGVTRFGYNFDDATVGPSGGCSQTDNGQNTFSRVIKIQSIREVDMPVNEIRVTVTVSWFAAGGLGRSVTITENLFKMNSI